MGASLATPEEPLSASTVWGTFSQSHRCETIELAIGAQSSAKSAWTVEALITSVLSARIHRYEFLGIPFERTLVIMKASMHQMKTVINPTVTRSEIIDSGSIMEASEAEAMKASGSKMLSKPLCFPVLELATPCFASVLEG